MQTGILWPGLLSMVCSMPILDKDLPIRISRNRRLGGTLLRRLEIILLLLLVLAVVFLWTAPRRQEQALKTASLATLESASRQPPGNPRVGYDLRLRLREVGRLEEALAA